MKVGSHVNWENDRPTRGQAVIDAVIRAAAIDRVEGSDDGVAVGVWKANADEQIEAALSEAGYKLVKQR